MRNMKKLIAITISSLVAIGAAGCQLVSKTPQGERNTVVAKVGGEKITKGELEDKFAPMLAQIEKQQGKDFVKSKEGQDFIKQQKTQFLDQMVEDKIILQKGNELKLIPDDKTLDAKTKEILDSAIQNAGGEDKFKKQIEENLKMSLDDYKKLVRDYMKVELTREKLYDSVTKDIKVTDEDALKYYNEHLYDYTEKPNKLYFAHILVKDEAQAKKIKKELDGGANFAELAKKYSEDPGSKDNGGEYREGLEYASLDKAFLTGALAQPIGKIGEPVKTTFGYHIIKVNKKEEYKAKPFESVKNEVKEKIANEKKPEKFNQAMEDWKKKAGVKTYPDRI
jgi:foldase protein PrsA